MNRLLVDRLRRAARNPGAAFRYLSGWASRASDQRRFVSNFLSGEEEFQRFRKELMQSDLLPHLKRKEEEFYDRVRIYEERGWTYNVGAITPAEGVNLYSLLRKLKPDLAVETGVCNGVSTAFILLALHENGKGRLYSIDLPEVAGRHYEEGTFWLGKGGAVIPEGEEPGWMIPPYLKDRWDLILGKSQDELPPLLARLGSIDFFLHDSEHSYECMWFEYNEAYRVLRVGGVLMSDDIIWNGAFQRFARERGEAITRIGPGLGFIVKGTA